MVDLAVTKTATPSPDVPGQPLTYTVTVTNGGTLDAPSGRVFPIHSRLPPCQAPGSPGPARRRRAVPAQLAALGDITDTVTIPAGGNLVYTVTGTVPASVQTGLTNTATVTHRQGPPTRAARPGAPPPRPISPTRR